ncbi:MAG TPA: type 1 glutamine amidotransferase [Bacteroidetes bacterium]|nr:type 1 glutamine amidotransferase [Bacteroidota bacterium]
MGTVFTACSSGTGRSEEKPVPNIAVLLTEGFHDAEAYMPMGYLVNKGFDVTVIGPEKGLVKAYNSEFTIVVERDMDELVTDDFDVLVIPGGQAPAALREDPAVVAFVRAFFETGKPVAAICHGPQVLITAGVMEGMTSSGYSGIREELESAGATYMDQALVTDKNLITSRVPADLAVFSRAIGETLEDWK